MTLPRVRAGNPGKWRDCGTSSPDASWCLIFPCVPLAIESDGASCELHGTAQKLCLCLIPMRAPSPCQAEKVQIESVDRNHGMTIIRPDCGSISEAVEC